VTAGYNDRLYYCTLGHEGDVSVTYRCCYLLLPGTYTGDSLAAEVQRALTLSGKGDQSPAVTYNAATGKIHVEASDAMYRFQIPSMAQLQDPAFIDGFWLAPTNPTLQDGPDSLPLDRNNLRAANATLNMPSNDGDSSLDTGVVNLAPIQQLYVHTNVSDYSSLTATGSQDVLAVIQVTENFGSCGALHDMVAAGLGGDPARGGPADRHQVHFHGQERRSRPLPSGRQRLHIAHDPGAADCIGKGEWLTHLLEQGGEPT
jgi:hypothetical protein